MAASGSCRHQQNGGLALLDQVVSLARYCLVVFLDLENFLIVRHSIVRQKYVKCSKYLKETLMLNLLTCLIFCFFRCFSSQKVMEYFLHFAEEFMDKVNVRVRTD